MKIFTVKTLTEIHSNIKKENMSALQVLKLSIKIKNMLIS